MEAENDTNIMGYIKTTIRIDSFIMKMLAQGNRTVHNTLMFWRPANR